jgi:hypothetical protein
VGHPATPNVFGHGHFDHFEYLAMELLGPSLGDVMEEKGKLCLECANHYRSTRACQIENVWIGSNSTLHLLDIVIGAHTWAGNSPTRYQT